MHEHRPLPFQMETVLGTVYVNRLLGKGKSGYSYLASLNHRPVVFKWIHYEPCDYYQFPENKTACELQAYQRLQQIGVRVPELIHADTEQNFIIKQYIAAPTVVEAFQHNPLPSTLLQQLFTMASNCQTHQHNLDYFPTNFVYANDQLYYVDYEINQYAQEWDLQRWGLYYWANLAGVQRYLNTGDFLAINHSLQNAKPIQDPFEQQVQQWINQFDQA